MKQETKENAILHIIIIAAVIFLTLLVMWFQDHFYTKKELNEVIESAYDKGWDAAHDYYGEYDDGYHEGYQDGTADGYDEGFEDGYDCGFDDGLISADD